MRRYINGPSRDPNQRNYITELMCIAFGGGKGR